MIATSPTPDKATGHIPLGLRAGEWVVVKSAQEILATLDQNARLENLPFQPEMFALCGRRLRVAKVAHKTCDTINKTGGRAMSDAVHLEGAHCDGAFHGGCQADCVFFWKEMWLRRAEEPSNTEPTVGASSTACSMERVHERVHAKGAERADDPIWVCQTTALFEATTPLRWWDVRQYVRDVTTGNHTGWHVSKMILFAGYRKLVETGVGYRLWIFLFNLVQRLRRAQPYPLSHGSIPDGARTPLEVLDLRPGEWVRVRSQQEILATLNESGFNRGMRYDIEMSKYCGERHRVQMRVDRLINEQTGKMTQTKNSCIQLEDVYCRSECSRMRLGCPRALNHYWREIWLRRD